MKMVSILIYIHLFGCGHSASVYYYEKIDSNGKLYGEKLIKPKTYNSKTYTIKDRKDFQEALDNYVVRDNTKEYCVYSLLFIPINFWDITNSYSRDIQRAIKDLNSEGKNGNQMKNIIFWDSTTALLPLFLKCSTITGTLIEE